ncbi:hypothetical protein [Streptomyces sp. NPDC053367]|uniref:hypothetical protein n=1 Tax=Streptomyces sp. NPDC053367 TaxID=3365700 RepID=UPI0037D96EA9
MDNVPIVRAGDTLIVCMGRETTQQERDLFWEQIKAGLPGLRVAFLENVTGLAVFRPDCAESTMPEPGE